jgi:Nucleotide-diphospho-sugar transferase
MRSGLFYIRPTAAAMDLLDRLVQRVETENGWDQVATLQHMLQHQLLVHYTTREAVAVQQRGHSQEDAACFSSAQLMAASAFCTIGAVQRGDLLPQPPWLHGPAGETARAGESTAVILICSPKMLNCRASLRPCHCLPSQSAASKGLHRC